MAGPWEKYQEKGQASGKPWEKYATQPSQDQSAQGMILPISRDAEGNVSFDSDAGILGALKRTFMLPGQVMKGEVDPLSGEGIERAFEFSTMASPASAAMKAGERVIPGVKKALRRPDLNPPTAEELKAASKSQYDAARDMAVDYSADAVQNLANSAIADLEKDGILGELAPKTFSLLKRLGSPPEGAIATGEGLEAARRAFGNAAKDFSNPTEQLAAKRVVERLDSFLEGPDEASVVAGAAADAARLRKTARGNYAASKRSDQITGIREDAELDAAAANSGANADNRTRQRVKALLQSPKKRAGYSDAELEQLRKVVEGTRSSNIARAAGNLLGGGGGLGGLVTSGFGGGAGIMAGSPTLAALGAGLPIAGRWLKAVSDSMTGKALRQADKLTRKRSPLYEALIQGTPAEAIPAEKRAALIRALLLSEQSGAQN